MNEPNWRQLIVIEGTKADLIFIAKETTTGWADQGACPNKFTLVLPCWSWIVHACRGAYDKGGRVNVYHEGMLSVVHDCRVVCMEQENDDRVFIDLEIVRQ